MEFGFGTGLKAQVELAAVRDNLLDHGLHLVDLDRIDNKVLSVVVILFGSPFEAAGRLLDTVVQNIRETEQHGGRDIAEGELIEHLAQVYLHAVLAGRHADVAAVVDIEIRGAPATYII